MFRRKVSCASKRQIKRDGGRISILPAMKAGLQSERIQDDHSPVGTPICLLPRWNPATTEPRRKSGGCPDGNGNFARAAASLPPLTSPIARTSTTFTPLCLKTGYLEQPIVCREVGVCDRRLWLKAGSAVVSTPLARNILDISAGMPDGNEHNKNRARFVMMMHQCEVEMKHARSPSKT